MNVIVQMDKEEFDKMSAQAAHNMNSLQTLCVDTAWKMIDNLVQALHDADESGNGTSFEELSSLLSKTKQKFGYSVLHRVNELIGHEPMIPKYPPPNTP